MTRATNRTELTVAIELARKVRKAPTSADGAEEIRDVFDRIVRSVGPTKAAEALGYYHPEPPPRPTLREQPHPGDSRR